MQYRDNTMISCFRICPRKYFFRHVKHWKGEGTALPLSFGLSWHEAMDVVWGLTNKTDKTQKEVWNFAMQAFLETWKSEGLPIDILPADLERYKNRHPGTAAEMLNNYISTRWTWLKGMNVLEIEKPFAVSIGLEDITYIGRLDKVFETREGIFVGEHKTTSAYAIAGGFRQQYIESYSPNSQVDGYSHALHIEYGERAKGVIVDAALVHKTVHDKFLLIPVNRQLSMMDDWLSETRYWVRQIEQHTQAFEDLLKQDTELMGPVFPKNTGACWDYQQECTYRDICRFSKQPHLGEVPNGMIVEEWKPYEILGFSK